MNTTFEIKVSRISSSSVFRYKSAKSIRAKKNTSTTYDINCCLTQLKIIYIWIKNYLPFFKNSKLASYPLKVFLVIVLDPYISTHVVRFQYSILSMERRGTNHLFSKFGQKFTLTLMQKKELGTSYVKDNPVKSKIVLTSPRQLKSSEFQSICAHKQIRNQ